MATILEFRGGGGRVIHKPPIGGNCELILFPGVRYETLRAGAGADTAAGAKGGAKPAAGRKPAAPKHH